MARHPAIQAFLETGADLLSILEGSRAPLGPVLAAILRVRQAIADRIPAERAIAEAAALRPGDQDPEERLILLCSWATLSGINERHEEMRALLRQARALVGHGTPAELRVMAMLCEGYRAALLGDVRRRESLLKQSLGVLSRASPWFARVAWERAVVAAQRGRVDEAESEIRFLETARDAAFPPARVALALFFDAVERGRWSQAEDLMARIDRGREAVRPWAALLRIAEHYRLIAGLARPSGGCAVEPFAREAEDDVIVTRELLAGRPRIALRAALKVHARFPLRSMGSGFTSWDLVRAELACGNGESARRILAARRKRGNRHDLDDFFLARAERLAGKPQAMARFREARRLAERRGASGRIAFELSLAAEIPQGDPFRANAPRPGGGARRIRALSPGEGAAADAFVGVSPGAIRVREAVRRLAPLDVTVLVTGETGTGKELVARALHAAGPRRAGPFVPVNCGAIADSLLESELFGYEKGAFTGAERVHRGLFAAATGGTVFLDEVGEVSPRLQAALLRVLEDGEVRPVGSVVAARVDCRIVAATHADLDRLVARGLFRKDLLYRLRRVEITVPPLRARREDILPLALHFLNRDRPAGRSAAVTPDLAAHLRGQAWGGNVRELRNRIERMRLLAGDKPVYTREDFDGGPFVPLDLPPGPVVAAAGSVGGPRDPARVLAEGRSTMRRRERLKALFREHRALTRAEAIRILGVAPGTVTTDLKALVAGRFIEKVTPRRAPRTHFFRLRRPR